MAITGRSIIVVLATLMSVAFTRPVAAQSQSPKNVPWSGQRAETIPRGRYEVGVFSPLRYGLSERVELRTHPLAMFVLPNLAAKIQWDSLGPWRLSTHHGFHIPTLMLRLLAREGTGGVLPDPSIIPFILGLENGFVATAQIPNAPHWVTITSGVSIAPRFAEADFPTIDLAVIYPRTMAYHTIASTYGSIALEGALGGPFHYHVIGKGFFATGLGGAFALEQTIRLVWRPSRTFQLTAGVLSSISSLPFGTDARWLPLLDAHFAF